MTDNETTRGRQILETAHCAWTAMAPLRSRRRRHRRFTYGDQWSDITRDRLNRPLTEEEEALRSGCKPLTNNLIRRMVKTVVGRFRQQRTSNPEASRAASLTAGASLILKRYLEHLLALSVLEKVYLPINAAIAAEHASEASTLLSSVTALLTSSDTPPDILLPCYL